MLKEYILTFTGFKYTCLSRHLDSCLLKQTTKNKKQTWNFFSSIEYIAIFMIIPVYNVLKMAVHDPNHVVEMDICVMSYLENNRWFSAVLLCMYWRIIHGLNHILIRAENHLLLSFLYYTTIW